MAGRFSIEAVFRAVDRVTAPVSRMQNRVGKFTRTAGRGFHKLNRSVEKFSRGLKRGAVVVAASTAVLGTAMFSVLGTGAQFEQAITNVGAVAMQTRAQIAPLEQMAIQLGRTTKFTATQSANAMEILAKAGFNTQQILKATPAILSAAAASGLEIAEVADHVSNVLKGMGLEVSRAAEVADILALASSRTNSTIGTLGESMRNVASTARQLKIPITDVVASVALLQDVGLDASVAGSAMNTMLTKMAAPTAGMQKKMRRLGVSFKDAKGDMLPLSKVLQQLSKASQKVGGNFDKVAFLAELVGLRGQKAASNLADLFETGKLEKLTKELENSKGAADKMARLRMDTVVGSMTLLGSAVDAVKVRIFNLNSGPLKTIIDDTTKWVGLNEQLIATGVGDFIKNAIPPLKTFAGFMGSIASFVFALGSGLGIVAAKMVGVFESVVNSPAFQTFMDATTAVNDFLERGFGQIASGASVVAGGLGQVTDFFDSFFEGGATATAAVTKPVNVTIPAEPDAMRQPVSGGPTPQTMRQPISGDPTPQIVSPQERIARSIEEQRTTSTAEVTIKDDSGRAEVTGGTLGPGLKLQRTGVF